MEARTVFFNQALCAFCQRSRAKYVFISESDAEFSLCARCDRYGTKQKNMMGSRVLSGESGVEAPEYIPFRGDSLPSVYFIQERAPENWSVVGGGPHGGPIKIGWAETPHLRLRELQSGNPRPLEIIGLITDCDMALEKALHKKFAHLRIRGEWFLDDDELIDFIVEKCYQKRDGGDE